MVLTDPLLRVNPVTRTKASVGNTGRLLW
jgi:hypothetical protein